MNAQKSSTTALEMQSPEQPALMGLRRKTVRNGIRVFAFLGVFAVGLRACGSGLIVSRLRRWKQLQA